MDYQKKTEEIEKAIEELRRIKYKFPLLCELIKRKQKAKSEYYARITLNLTLYGTSPMHFDDIEYP